MKILVVGLGSMGMRRLGNLSRQGRPVALHGIDPRADRTTRAAARFPLTLHPSLDAALAAAPDAAIVSTPPLAHTPVMKRLIGAGVPFLVEASVVDDDLAGVMTGAAAAGLVALPSATMRFHPAVRLMRRLIVEQEALGEDGSALSFNYHMGQYLPDWHPEEPIADYYVSARETSGAREMVCFENVWLSWLFGAPREVACLAARTTTLDADIEDVFQLLLRYAAGARGSMMIDTVSRAPYRSLRIVSERGVIEWSARENMLRHLDARRGVWADLSDLSDADYRGGNFTGEAMYDAEIAAFLAELDGQRGAYPYGFAEDRLILATLRQALASDRDRRILPVPDEAGAER